MSDVDQVQEDKKGGVPEEALTTRRVLQGKVLSDKPAKSVVVEVVHRVRHPSYGKYVTRRRRYMAHDEKDEYRAGDVVRIVECRPLSRRKRWRVQALVERPQ
jgi:small subunit ribosomal protein S17